jgi:hypothetical protein
MDSLSDPGMQGFGDSVVTGRELSDVLGITDAHVRKLKNQGILQSIGPRNKNEFMLGASVRAYIQFKCGSTKLESEADYHAEKAKKERANRILREILVDQTRGNLHESDDVRAIVGDAFSQVRSKLLAMPNVLTLQVVGLDNPLQVKKVLETYIRGTCESLHDYDPQTYYKRSKIALALIKDLEQEQERETEERDENGD